MEVGSSGEQSSHFETSDEKSYNSKYKPITEPITPIMSDDELSDYSVDSDVLGDIIASNDLSSPLDLAITEILNSIFDLPFHELEYEIMMAELQFNLQDPSGQDLNAQVASGQDLNAPVQTAQVQTAKDPSPQSDYTLRIIENSEHTDENTHYNTSDNPKSPLNHQNNGKIF